MASRESTPDSGASGRSSPIFLTPNSKIQKLLAPLYDNYSHLSKETARDCLPTTILEPPAFKTEPTTTVKDVDSIDGDHQIREDEDEDVFIRPKCRMAASMQVGFKPRVIQSVQSCSPKGKAKENPNSENKSVNRPITCDDSDDRGEIHYGPVTPKNKRQIRHRNSPKSSSSRNCDSPSLFLTPQNISLSTNDVNSSDSEPLPKNLFKNSRFMALVEKKRAAQLASQAEDAQQRAQEAQQQKIYQDFLNNVTDSEDSNGDVGDHLINLTRPLRKASKKALEEMNRETQRIIRQQQLAHKPAIRKKITKESLFSRFNFKPHSEIDKVRPASSSSANCRSDVEMNDTPPTSPARLEIRSPAKCLEFPNEDCKDRGTCDITNSSKEILTDKLKSSSPIRSSEKTKFTNTKRLFDTQMQNKEDLINVKSARIRHSDFINMHKLVNDDSDSELEITNRKPTPKKRLDKIFNQIPVKKSREANGFHALKMLAQIKSPPKQNISVKSVTTAELQISLQQRARKQAALERLEREQVLKAKGIDIQTNEEKERDQAEIDDLLSKARAEARLLGKQERAEAELLEKQELAAIRKSQNNYESDSNNPSSDDEEWKDDKDAISESLESSNSDDPDASSLLDEDGCRAVTPEEKEVICDETISDTCCLTTQADYIQSNSEDHDADVESGEEDNRLRKKDHTSFIQCRRRARDRNIISDDEEEVVYQEQKTIPTKQSYFISQGSHSPSLAAPPSVLRSASKDFIPGLPVSGPAGLGLTQIFTGTMDDSQVPSSPLSSKVESNNDLVDLLRRQAPPSLPYSPIITNKMDSNLATNLSQSNLVSDSQANDANIRSIHLDISPSLGPDSDNQDIHLQLSFVPEMTQDTGFVNLSPLTGRFDHRSPSKIQITNSETINGAKIWKSKKKLYQKSCRLAENSSKEALEKEIGLAVAPETQDEREDVGKSVFDVMKEASKRKISAQIKFNKIESRAKDMFNEQAEESDDEYAGLGGISDDPSDSDEDEYVRDMIDDESEKVVDSAETAAFFANRERVDDEKHIEKLYHDITKGMLRRKRGADYELSDSDDGGEARRRRKRQEFVKMRKALLADERISKMASNPKSQAFLRAIEDREGSEDEIDFLVDCHVRTNDDISKSDSQQQTTSLDLPDESKPHEISENGIKQAPYVTRNSSRRKPSNLSEIRQSLSSLLDDPEQMEKVDFLSDSDPEESAKTGDYTNDRATLVPKNRFDARENHRTVIDRISLKRNAPATSEISHSRQAFAPLTSASGFIIPPLLQRTTGNSVVSSVSSGTDSSGFSKEREVVTESRGVKRGGVWGSGVNYFARETERRAKLVKTESRRERKLAKIAMSRRKFIDNLFGAGSFE